MAHTGLYDMHTCSKVTPSPFTSSLLALPVLATSPAPLFGEEGGGGRGYLVHFVTCDVHDRS